MVLRNIFQEIGLHSEEELIESISGGRGIRIERIVSYGHSSPPGFWYVQDSNEFVLLISGSAGLLFEGEDEIVVMQPGDYLDIPAYKKHRVEWTDQRQPTIWLAVHSFIPDFSE
ncbi:Cupin domain-containing protein [uncultured Desulfobacterium sp.]|uniref:Cupin domain-containing protein n=1 Tax=uncultured Desulfobacterium sp. TaxID=201089 RepID=A0A445N2K4_9BACT|nr:Cupin domain-containing protein [uncultured Desulfobacterium sp.]